MQLHSLKPAQGATKQRKRVGRGQGSGRGGTSTRGHKGAQSRSGYSRKQGFEGGQMPLQRRIPKRGFKNVNRVSYIEFNLDKLVAIAEKYNTTEISPEFLYSNRLIQKSDLIKVLGRGEISSALTITAHKASASATEAIAKSGGTLTILEAK